jgi:hypothetical protein
VLKVPGVNPHRKHSGLRCRLHFLYPMNSRDRRRLRRRSNTNEPPQMSASQLHTQDKETRLQHKPQSQHPISLLRSLMAASARNFWGLLLAAATLIGGYAIARPNVSVDPDLVLVPGDPYSTQFSVKNENAAFGVRDIQPSCQTIRVITSNNFGMLGLPSRPQPVVPKLDPGQKTTMECWPIIGGLGAGSGKVLTAYIEIHLSYRENWWPWSITQPFPLKGVVDSQGGVHWVHITEPELIAALRNPN